MEYFLGSIILSSLFGLVILINQLHRIDYFYRKKYCTKCIEARVTKIKYVPISRRTVEYYLPAYGFRSEEYPGIEFYKWYQISEEKFEIGEKVVIKVHPKNPMKFYFPMEQKPGFGNSIVGLIALIPLLFIIYYELTVR